MLKKITFSVTFVVATLLALVALFNTATMIKRARTGDNCPTLFGFASAVVISGSMEPTILVNDLVIIHEKDAYEVGDIVTFRSTGLPVTHRIIGERTDADGTRYFITQGDNNNAPDTGEVTPDRIVGEVVQVVPRFGYVQSFLQKPIGFVTLTAALLLCIVAPDLILRLVGRFGKQTDAEREGEAPKDGQG